MQLINLVRCYGMTPPTGASMTVMCIMLARKGVAITDIYGKEFNGNRFEPQKKDV